MTDITRVVQGPPPIAPKRTVSARFLARNMAAILREVADDGHAFAVEHFGRVVGFLVPREGRELVRHRGKVSWEVPEPVPLLDLGPREAGVIDVMGRLGGRALPDELLREVGGIGEVGVALMNLEITERPLVRKVFGGYELTEEGLRHYESLKAGP